MIFLIVKSITEYIQISDHDEHLILAQILMTEMDLEDETESVRILGIGVGLFLIILVCAYFCHQCLQWS